MVTADADPTAPEVDEMDDAQPPPSSSSSSSSSSLRSFVAGGVGGACSVLVGYPLDLVKVRMQTASAGGGGGGGDRGSSTTTTTTVSGVLSETIRREGPRGLFRGVAAPLFTVAPVMAVAFWGYDVGRRAARSCSGGTRAEELSGAEVCVAGAISALPTSVILGPTERIKCLLQAQSNGAGGGKKTTEYAGALDCTRKVWEEGGARSLFRGTGMMFAREIPGTVAYFATYEYVKGEIMVLQGVDPKDGRLSLPAVTVAGGLAGMAYWSVGITIVADVVKSRYQTAPLGEYERYADVYRALVKEGGYAGLFRGLRPAILRAIPASMACFLGMEATRKVLEFI
ncbi:hypothetical protein ACHAW5_008687 [Stephanodiscus triporus]|uniref:Mitochondrial carrier protein n=1 Tax=Stephanodiscus triporus TaxID=2934178 RepID=A0ABD3NW90_9STRA